MKGTEQQGTATPEPKSVLSEDALFQPHGGETAWTLHHFHPRPRPVCEGPCCDRRLVLILAGWLEIPWSSTRVGTQCPLGSSKEPGEAASACGSPPWCAEQADIPVPRGTGATALPRSWPGPHRALTGTLVPQVLRLVWSWPPTTLPHPWVQAPASCSHTCCREPLLGGPLSLLTVSSHPRDACLCPHSDLGKSLSTPAPAAAVPPAPSPWAGVEGVVVTLWVITAHTNGLSPHGKGLAEDTF